MQDQLSPAPLRKFDFTAYLDWMQAYNHNFMRGWAWEQAAWDNHTKEKLLVEPLPYLRTGPGNALDGRPKFDLTQFNQEYFDRIRARVVEAGERGIYVSVMLFEGFSVDNRNQYGGNPWLGHPFNVANNINGIDGDPGGTSSGRAVHTLAIPAITALQEAYVKKVVDTVNDLDNVLYEIGNEHYADSAEWQYHIINLIHNYEVRKPKQHPVGITSGGGGQDRLGNGALFNSPADWISLRHESGQEYRDNPPAADGSKVILTDTDHLWGLGGNQAWVWKSFTRGLNPILMDPYEPLYGLDAFPGWGPLNNHDNPLWEPIRRNLGYTLRYANRMNLVSMIPRDDLASTKYCLVNLGFDTGLNTPSATQPGGYSTQVATQPKGPEYLIYLPDGGEVTVDLSAVSGTVAVECFNPSTGITMDGETTTRGVSQSFTAPFNGDAVLYLCSA